MNHKRIEWVDFAKAICAICVIIYHSEFGNSFLSKYYEPFFLNGFLFLSGYTYSHKDDFGNFLKKKTQQLLIPWLCLGTIIVITGNIYSPSPETHGGLLIDFLFFLAQIREKNDAMWFVAALFISYVPFYFIVDYYNNKKDIKNYDVLSLLALLLIYVLFSFFIAKLPSDYFPWGNDKLPWHIEYLPNSLFFMYFGYLYRNSFEKRELLSDFSLVFLLILYVFLVNSHFHFSLFFLMCYTILKQIISTVLLVSICKRIKPSNIMLRIGKNSLFSFGMAHYISVPLQMIIKKILPTLYSYVISNYLVSALFSIVFAFVVSVLLLIPSDIIERLFPFILGKKTSK